MTLLRLDTDDTIVAIATPPGPSLRGVVRLSGPAAWDVALASFVTWPESATFHARPGRHPGTLAVNGLRPRLPVELALWAPGRSYTGQALAEVHMTGAAPVLQAVVADLLQRGARLATRGEFTLRAYLNGRIDLARAEAVLAVLEARSPRQLERALDQLAGGLSTPIAQARDTLLDLLAHLEAGLDFVDEADVGPLATATLIESAQRALAVVEALAHSFAVRRRDDQRPRVSLIGPPNAGKSRLFNALIGDDHALVTPVAGTTRDVNTHDLVFDGVPLTLVDTAGIEPARSPIEAEAQGQREGETTGASLLLCCSGPLPEGPPVELPAGALVLRIGTKADLSPRAAGAVDIVTSAATGEGIDGLRSLIATSLRHVSEESGPLETTAARCGDGLRSAAEAIRNAIDCLNQGGGHELAAIDLRRALDDLGEALGDDAEVDVLDRVFHRFCIGK